MSKLSIADAALKLGVSKEAIHNRIRRGSLKSVIEDGVKFVLLEDAQTLSNKPPQRRKSGTKQLFGGDERYYKLLEQQNERLQQKVDRLESETKTLREQKEQMLIEERLRIEQIYKDKDEQLKSILNAISSKFLPNQTDKQTLKQIDEEIVETEIQTNDAPLNKEPKKEKNNKLIPLKKYLKKQKISQKKSKKIKKEFKKASKNDKRIITIGKKLYINPKKYEYKDLIPD